VGLLSRFPGQREDRDGEYLEFAVGVEDQLYRVAYALCGNRQDAEQYVQDTFVKLLEHWHRVDAQRNRRAYTMTILKNLIRNDLRRQAHQGQSIITVPTETICMDFVQLYPRLLDEDKTTEIHLLAAVKQLTRKQQQVVILRYWADLSIRDVADLLDITVATVKTHINDALRCLRALLVNEEADR
jgi:RNA polymerase sigma factor (sigma-70 family)